jgi:hypothetical protein
MSDEQTLNPQPSTLNRERLALTWAEGEVLSSRGLRSWAASLKKHSRDCRIVILSPEPVTIPDTENVIIDPANRGAFVLHRRWSAYSHYLGNFLQKETKEAKVSDSDPSLPSLSSVNVLLSDCRDLVFQADPFSLLQSSNSQLPSPIFVCSEQQKSGEHPWTRDKALKLEARIKFKQDLTRIEINGGLQLGPLTSMQLFCAAMEAGLYCGVDTDQAFLNWWFYHRCPVPWQFAPDHWYIHGEAVKRGKQRVKIIDGAAHVANDHKTTGPRDNGTEKVSGQWSVVSGQSRPAAVFHQYDRTPHAGLFLNNSQLSTLNSQHLKSVPLLILVAHYNENLSWLDKLAKLANKHIIISKSASPPDGSIARANIGCEAETWAWFFAEYYDDLPQVIVCVQGKPFDHIQPVLFNQILAQLSNLLQKETKETKDSDFPGAAGPSLPSLSSVKNSSDFSYVPISTPGHRGFTGLDVPDHKGLPMREWWARLFKSPPPLNWYCPYGGQFAVHREAVRARSREYWRNISEHCQTRNDACTLERLWQFILIGLP